MGCIPSAKLQECTCLNPEQRWGCWHCQGSNLPRTLPQIKAWLYTIMSGWKHLSAPRLNHLFQSKSPKPPHAVCTISSDMPGATISKLQPPPYSNTQREGGGGNRQGKSSNVPFKRIHSKVSLGAGGPANRAALMAFASLSCCLSNALCLQNVLGPSWHPQHTSTGVLLKAFLQKYRHLTYENWM